MIALSAIDLNRSLLQQIAIIAVGTVVFVFVAIVLLLMAAAWLHSTSRRRGAPS